MTHRYDSTRNESTRLFSCISFIFACVVCFLCEEPRYSLVGGRVEGSSRQMKPTIAIGPAFPLPSIHAHSLRPLSLARSFIRSFIARTHSPSLLLMLARGGPLWVVAASAAGEDRCIRCRGGPLWVVTASVLPSAAVVDRGPPRPLCSADHQQSLPRHAPSVHTSTRQPNAVQTLITALHSRCDTCVQRRPHRPPDRPTGACQCHGDDGLHDAPDHSTDARAPSPARATR